MELVADRFRPGRPESRDAMESLQAEIADAASFGHDAEFAPAEIDGGVTVAGIDQAFLDDRAVSAVVVLRGGEIIAREHASVPLSMPVRPGTVGLPRGRVDRRGA